ncbi:hypothetical protein ACSSZE_16735 [Acidithiobacillus caldus]
MTAAKRQRLNEQSQCSGGSRQFGLSRLHKGMARISATALLLAFLSMATVHGLDAGSAAHRYTGAHRALPGDEASKVGPRLLNAPAGTKRPASHSPPATIARF